MNRQAPRGSSAIIVTAEVLPLLLTDEGVIHMRKLMSAVLLAICTAGVAVSVAPAAQAAGQGCRYYYTSWGQGPNGETSGYGQYAEGDRDPEDRVCENGWWVSPNEDDQY